MEKDEFRAMIKYLHMKGLRPKEIKAKYIFIYIYIYIYIYIILEIKIQRMKEHKGNEGVNAARKLMRNYDKNFN